MEHCTNVSTSYRNRAIDREKKTQYWKCIGEKVQFRPNRMVNIGKSNAIQLQRERQTNRKLKKKGAHTRSHRMHIENCNFKVISVLFFDSNYAIKCWLVLTFCVCSRANLYGKRWKGISCDFFFSCLFKRHSTVGMSIRSVSH